MAGAGVGGEGGGWAWRCGRLRPRLPAPAAGLSGPGSSDVPRQECPSSDNVIYISGRVRGSAAPGARRPLCQEPRAALLPLRCCCCCRPRALAGRRYSPSAGESREGPAVRGGWVWVLMHEAGARGESAEEALGPWDRMGAQSRVPGVRAARGPGGPGGCGSERPGARESAWASEALGELGACFGEPDPGASPGGAGRAARCYVFWCWAASSSTPAGGRGGFCLSLPGLPRCPLCPHAAGFLSLGAAHILFWGTWRCAPPPAQRPGREDRAGRRRAPSPRR